MRGGDLSPVELTQAYLGRIERLNPTLNAYLTVTASLALAQAREAERVLATGSTPRPLTGIPMALKDNIDVAGVPTTAGSPFLIDHIADHDAAVTLCLREAGAVLLGKLNLHEWAIGATTRNPHFGAARNPWDPSRITGGSSGGSGAVTAAGMALFALGSDTGGSIRIPAALCGVSGLRPTTGLVALDGIVPMSWTFDTVSPLVRRAEDLELVLEVLTHLPDHGDAPREGLSGVSAGVIGGFIEREADPEVRRIVREAARALGSLGARVDEIEIDGIEETFPAFRAAMMADASAFHEQRLQEHPELFGEDVRARLEGGTQVTGREYARARQGRRLWRDRLREVFADYPLLVTPTCAIAAPVIEESEGVAMSAALTRFTHPFSLAGTPALSVPCGFTAGGLPVGMQLVAAPGRDRWLLGIARRYQEITDWHLRVPPLAL
jgi:aspartyl-tRNA(Asn)/glutamyl-tRNA(Gln) amidotransferase subunit A